MKSKVNKRLTLVALSLLLAMNTTAEVNDSIDTYQNQTVNNQVEVQGRDVLTVNNVTVNSTGHLKLSSPNGIVIPAGLTVELGGILELNGGRQWLVRYTYDAAGNRIRRQRNQNN